MNVPKYITIRDDLMFKTVFSDERLLRELLSRVLPDIDISHLKLVISEKTFDGPGKSHGIRVDIYAEDGTRVYVVGMQNRMAEFHPKRARYYQADVDTGIFLRSSKYSDLKDSFIIIFMTEDRFRKNRIVYRYRTMCTETGDVLDDGREIIYVNFACSENDTEYPGLLPLCTYIREGTVTDAFVKEIDEQVKRYNNSEDWRQQHMEWFHYNYDMIEAGEIRGERKGKKEEQKYSIRNLYEIALKNGAKNEDVLALIEQKYPEYSSSAIQEILNS